MRSGVQSGGNAVAPRRTRSFGSPIRIIAISHCTENLPSIREEDHKKRKRCHTCSIKYLIETFSIHPLRVAQVFEPFLKGKLSKRLLMAANLRRRFSARIG
jgi:hypothetical protein